MTKQEFSRRIREVYDQLKELANRTDELNQDVKAILKEVEMLPEAEELEDSSPKE